MEDKFKVQFQGNAHCFLLMRISSDKHGNYILDQSRNTKNSVRKHLGSVSSGKCIKMPLPADFIATKKDASENILESEE